MAIGTFPSRDILQLPDCDGRPTCDPVPVCPACGGLECLCRPRFFAGQLLTEEDLNRLDHYIQAKNRLHNRYLHGWGVACGLEVVCGVCGPDQRHVIVKPGYALSPCGNDIVVCRPEQVDVCDLINRCRPPSDDCRDMFTQPTPGSAAGQPGVPDPGNCPGGTEEWVLAVCYTETPSRGVAVLRATPADCGCGCGAANGDRAGHGGHGGGHGAGGNGGCGCGGKSATAVAPRRVHAAPHPRSLPEQCEPTVTCEGYRFVVYKAPKVDPDQRQLGAAARRFLCCLEPLFKELGGLGASATPQQAQNWVVAFRDAVQEFVLSEGLYDCEIAQRLAAIVIPAVTNEPPNVVLGQFNQTAAAISAIAALVVQKCFCAALLPPCPEPALADCVPLATVTVTRQQCRVVRVCDLSARKFLVTIPNIAYWLSFFSLDTIGTSIRRILEAFCCRPFAVRNPKIDQANFFGSAAAPPAQPAGTVGTAAATGGAAPPGGGQPPTLFASLLWSALTSPDRRVGVEDVLLGALGARDAQGQPFASRDELAHASEFLVLNQVVAPLARAVVPRTDELMRTATQLAGGPPETERLEQLARELAELKATIARQERTPGRGRRR